MVCLIKTKPREVEVVFDEKQLLELFRCHDKNGDGCLDRRELKHAFKELGSRSSSVRTKLALWNVDRDGNGYITGDEMKALAEYAARCGYTIK